MNIKEKLKHLRNLKAKKALEKITPVVGIVMSSKLDWDIMQYTELTLGLLAVPREVNIICPHHTPELTKSYAESAAARGIKILIAGSANAGHLPGILATHTPLPVLGVPIPTEALKGLDALLSIVQMPAGMPVGTLGIGRAGAINAALLAAEIMGIHNQQVKDAVLEYRARQTKKIKDNPDPRKIH
jgi:5-(carboxyamino)imidazole ribonucleotide mutase